MNPRELFCPNMNCPARGQVGKVNIHVHSQKDKRGICEVCGQTFTTTTGTIFYRLHSDPQLVMWVTLPVLLASPDAFVDLASMGFDLYMGDAASFALDAASLAVPSVTGLGALSRADKVYDALRATNKVDNVYDTAHSVNRLENSNVAYRSVEHEYGSFRVGFPQQSRRATEIMEEAATISNVPLSKYVDVVYFSPHRKYPLFDISPIGERYVVLDIKTVLEPNKAHQLKIGSHELVHAQQFEQLVRSKFNGDVLAAADFWHGPLLGSQFNKGFMEVIAERLAYQRVERYFGRMSPFEYQDTLYYLNEYRPYYLPRLP